MNYFFKRENVDGYKSMIGDYDNSFMMGEIKNQLQKGSSLLELGMGTGVDLVELSKDYIVTGSDNSPLFIEDFTKEHPEINAIVLDAVTVDIQNKFDCIYSNKVLQHLTPKDFTTSLKNQSEHLNKNGIIFMTLWHGDFAEEIYDEDLRFMYYRLKDIEKLLPKNLEITYNKVFTEMEKDDSIIVIMKAK